MSHDPIFDGPEEVPQKRRPLERSPEQLVEEARVQLKRAARAVEDAQAAYAEAVAALEAHRHPLAGAEGETPGLDAQRIYADRVSRAVAASGQRSPGRRPSASERQRKVRPLIRPPA